MGQNIYIKAENVLPDGRVMDNAALMNAIGRNISINVETIPQNKNVILNESNNTPVHVRIKLHNKDDVPSRKFHVSQPKATQYMEKPIKQCCSEQTILSFNLLVEPDGQKTLIKPRKRFFNRLLPNACMGVQISDDEDPYLPSATRKKFSNTTQNSGTSDFKDSNRRDKKSKFRPGGCLDPNFSDEKIAYKPSIKIPIEKNDDINYVTQKEQTLLINKNNKDTKSIQSLYQAAKAKSSGLITYPHNGKEKVQEKRLSSEKSRRSSTFNQSAQYYFGQSNHKISADVTKQSSDSQKLSRELIKGSVIVEAVLANTKNTQSALQTQKVNIEMQKHLNEAQNSKTNKKNKNNTKKKQKYKPGGCLDPHVSDEDHYAYMPSKKEILKENDGISLITDIYKDEIRIKKHEPVKLLSQTKISSITEANIVKKEAVGEVESSVNVEKNKRTDSPKRNKALIATGGVTTGVAIGTVAESLIKNKKSSNDIKENKYERGGGLDPEIKEDEDLRKKEQAIAQDFESKNVVSHDFDPKKGQHQERPSLRDRFNRLSKNRLSTEYRKGDGKSNISVTKSHERKSSKGSFNTQLLKDDPSEKIISTTSRDPSRKSSPESRTRVDRFNNLLTNKSPERKQILRSDMNLSKELHSEEIAQSSKDLRDNSPKQNTLPMSTVQNEADALLIGKTKDKSRKSSPQNLSTELLDRDVEKEPIRNFPKSDGEKYDSIDNTEFQITKGQKTSPKRLSTDHFENVADSKLINKSPESKITKDTYKILENTELYKNQSQRSSPVKLSESKFSDKLSRKISPNRKSSKIEGENTDTNKIQSRKSSPKRLLNELEAKISVNPSLKRPSDQKKIFNSYITKEQSHIHKDQSRKSSPKKLSSEFIEKYGVNKSNKNSPERRYSNDTSGIQLLNLDLELDTKFSNVQSRRSSRQFSSELLKRTAANFSNLSIKKSSEHQNRQHLSRMSNFNASLEINNKSETYDNNLTKLQQINDEAGVHKEQALESKEHLKKSPDRKLTHDLNKTSVNEKSSESIGTSIHRSSKSGQDLPIMIPMKNISHEDNFPFSQSTDKKISSDILRKSTDKTKRSKHSTASMKSSIYKTPLIISEPTNDDNDLKDTTSVYKEKSENLDGESIDENSDYHNKNETIIAPDIKPEIFEDVENIPHILNEVAGTQNINKFQQQWSDDQTVIDYQRNKLSHQDMNADQSFSTLYEDDESKQSKVLSFKEEAALRQNSETKYVSNKPSINTAQNTHNINYDITSPGFQNIFTKDIDITDRNPTHGLLTDSPNLPYDVYDDKGHPLNLKDSVSKIFHPTSFRSKLDNKPLYEYEDYVQPNYQPATESNENDWSLDPKMPMRSPKLSMNKSQSRLAQYTRSLLSITSEDVLLENGPLVVDMAFQTYMNEANERVIKSINSNVRSNDSARSSKELYIVKQRFKKYSDKVQIPISSSSKLSIQVHKDQTIQNTRESRPDSYKKNSKIVKKIIISNPRSNSLSYLRHKGEDFENAGGKYSANRFMDVLGTIYEHELLPLQQIMKNLKIEIDRLTQEQIQLNKKMQRSSKADRLIPVNTTCHCHFK